MKLKHFIFLILIGLLGFGLYCLSQNYLVARCGLEDIPKLDNSSLKKQIQNGDIIFHSSKSNQSQAIQIATNSKYSHMGIIYTEGDQDFVYEAVQPVKLTKLDDWIDRGLGKKYVVKRLRDSKEILTKEGIQKMKSVGRRYLGKNYDLRFEWSDDKIYCSELVWKIYKEAFDIEIGKPEKFKDFDLSNETVKKKVKERYGNIIPMNELVITPDRMFRSKNLITVIDR